MLQYLKDSRMGNFCSQIHPQSSQKAEGQNSNTILSQFEIKNNIKVQLILGSYRQHQGDLLLVFAHLQDLDYSPEIKDYAQNYLQLIETTTSQPKPLINIHCNQSCPYKRFVVAILPPYNSQYSDNYLKQFEYMITEILVTCSQFTLQLIATSEDGKGVPNQTLISIFIKYLQKYERGVKISLISREVRLLNMVRYEMAKLGTYIGVTKAERDEQ